MCVCVCACLCASVRVHECVHVCLIKQRGTKWYFGNLADFPLQNWHSQSIKRICGIVEQCKDSSGQFSPAWSSQDNF